MSSKQLPTIVVSLVALLMAVRPVWSDVEWNLEPRYTPEPDRFWAYCNAVSNTQDPLTLEDCYGSWFGAVTGHCEDTMSSWWVDCETSKVTINCPEGGSTAWGYINGTVQGDSPSTWSYPFNGTCFEEEEW